MVRPLPAATARWAVFITWGSVKRVGDIPTDELGVQISPVGIPMGLVGCEPDKAGPQLRMRRVDTVLPESGLVGVSSGKELLGRRCRAARCPFEQGGR